jgi:membrane protein YqaA with SNARE-associated domain
LPDAASSELIILAAAMRAHLPGVLHTLEPTLNHYGYLAVAGLVLVEDFGVPVPGETVLILGAVYVGAGRLNIALVATLAFCGAVLGDNIGFAIGHFGGRAVQSCRPAPQPQPAQAHVPPYSSDRWPAISQRREGPSAACSAV